MNAECPIQVWFLKTKFVLRNHYIILPVIVNNSSIMSDFVFCNNFYLTTQLVSLQNRNQVQVTCIS